MKNIEKLSKIIQNVSIYYNIIGMFTFVEFLTFLALKLGGELSWGWLWIASPIWLWGAGLIVITFAMFVYVYVYTLWQIKNQQD